LEKQPDSIGRDRLTQTRAMVLGLYSSRSGGVSRHRIEEQSCALGHGCARGKHASVSPRESILARLRSSLASSGQLATKAKSLRHQERRHFSPDLLHERFAALIRTPSIQFLQMRFLSLVRINNDAILGRKAVLLRDHIGPSFSLHWKQRVKALGP